MSTMTNSAETTAAEAVAAERGKYALVLGIALAVVILDQLSKAWVDAAMRLHQSIPILEGFFSLTYVRNTGAAFSMFADMSDVYRVPFFSVVAVLAGGAILYFVRSTPPSAKLVLVACGFVLGGAVGNLIDRLAYGSVVDFLDVYYGDWHWPAFNVADTFISIGVTLLLLHSLLARD